MNPSRWEASCVKCVREYTYTSTQLSYSRLRDRLDLKS